MEDDKGTILLQLPNNELSELVSVNEICRLCANQNEKLIEIYGEEGENNNLATKINSYLSIKVDKIDNLPLQCCWQCASTVLAWHELVVTSIEVDRRFRVSQLVSFPEKQSQSSDETSLQPLQSRTENTKQTTVHQDESDDNCTELDSDSSSDEEVNEQKPDAKNKNLNEEYFNWADVSSNSCLACNKSFSKRTILNQHMFNIHNLKRTVVRRKKSEFDISFTCDQCKKSFSRKYDLQRHITKVHPDPNGAPSNRHKNYDLLRKHKVLDVDGIVYYKCDLCEVKVTKSSSFVDHYNIHLNKKLHCCDLCGKDFRTRSQVKRHINIVHYGLRKFVCEFCDQAFSSKSAKDEHVNTHTNNRPYMCALCGKSFKQSSSLYVHKMFHDQVYRFSCQICNKKFKRGGELKKHQAVHTAKREFHCEVCNKSFKLEQHLKKHQKKTHASYSCEDCGMEFENDFELFQEHKKEHEESQYVKVEAGVKTETEILAE